MLADEDTSGNIKTINIQQARLGMFVDALDIPWIQSPFLRNKILLKTSSDLDKLRKSGAKTLSIDLDKGVDVAIEKEFDGISPPLDTLVTKETQDNILAEEPLNIVAATTTSAKPEPVVQDDNDDGEVTLQIDKAIELKTKIKQKIVRLHDKLSSGMKVDADEINEFVLESNKDISENINEMILLINAQERSQHLLDHHIAVFTMVIGLSNRMGIDQENKFDVATAALFHDIGWLKLPSDLFTKSDLNKKTHKALWEKHCELAKSYFKDTKIFTEKIRYLIDHHHYDISDDTQHLPEMAKVLNCLRVCDRYDEYLEGIAGHRCLTPKAALSTLCKLGIEDKLDETVVSHFIRMLSIYPIGSFVELSTGEVAQVVSENRCYPSQPKVWISANWSDSGAERITKDTRIEDINIVKEICKTDYKKYGISFA